MRPKTRSGKTLIIILAVCAVVSIAAGVGIGVFMGGRAQAQGKDKGHKGKPAKEHVHPAMVHGLGEMVVNMGDTDELRYAKINVAVGFEKKVDEEHLKETDPIFRDAIVEVLSRKTFKDLRKPKGIEELKAELLKHIAVAAGDQVVVAVYLDGFAMQ